MERMTLVLSPDDAQRDSLETFLEEQQNAQSPLYQHWLTPAEFGERFGVSQHDLDQTTWWLQQNGFTVEPAPASRRWLVFSGTAGHVESAFHTEVHTFRVNGRLHYASITNPEIPTALAEVVGSVLSLHDFETAPQHVAAPAATQVVADGSQHYLTPGAFSTIYNVRPLYAAGIDGSGQSLAIVSRSNVLPEDLRTFRRTYDLPANDVEVIVNGPDPGIVTGDEQLEAELDVELAGAVARNAKVYLVVSGSSSVADGIVLSAEYILEHNLAPVVSVSYGTCEAVAGPGGSRFWNALWQQAAAQGISVLVAAGDAGAAGCDNPAFDSSWGRRSVNALCSPPYATCVGGTEFADTANPALYWSSGAATIGSALSYIPESAWNESGLASEGSGLWAGGGGASDFYAKPTWQAGSGVPDTNERYVPDIALSSALHDGYPTVVNGQTRVVGGTSAAAPAFAALVALADQRRGNRTGNPNPLLYKLASLQRDGGGANVFHDVTTGNNSVPGLTGYVASGGYDPVTGLGSVDAANLVMSWEAGDIPAGGFQISAAATGLRVVPGGNGYALIELRGTGGFDSPVEFSIIGVPEGMTAVFVPGSVWTPGSGSPILILSSSAYIRPGEYVVTVNATGGGMTQRVPITVSVLAGAGN